MRVYTEMHETLILVEYCIQFCQWCRQSKQSIKKLWHINNDPVIVLLFLWLLSDLILATVSTKPATTFK